MMSVPSGLKPERRKTVEKTQLQIQVTGQGEKPL
jgi:hypothetical protein